MKKAERNEKAKALQTKIAHFPECNEMRDGILVKVVADQYTNEVKFLFRRIDGKGSFGKIKWSQANSTEYPEKDLSGLKWIEGKQKALTDFRKLEGWRLAALTVTDPSPKHKNESETPAARSFAQGKVITAINF